VEGDLEGNLEFVAMGRGRGQSGQDLCGPYHHLHRPAFPSLPLSLPLALPPALDPVLAPETKFSFFEATGQPPQTCCHVHAERGRPVQVGMEDGGGREGGSGGGRDGETEGMHPEMYVTVEMLL